MSTDTETGSKLFQYIAMLAAVTSLLLLIPLVAMQFTDEVVWTPGDFIFAGTMIFGTGLAYKLIARKSGNMIYRAAVGLALASGFILIWVNGAVGIIGSEANFINTWYYGVILVGLIGAFISRFQSRGMAFTMLAMAFGQALVACAALVGGYYQVPPSSVVEIIGVNGFFIALFVLSGLLFRKGASEGREITINE